MLDHRVFAVSGGCMAVRTCVFKSVGGFRRQTPGYAISFGGSLSKLKQLGLGISWTAQAQFRSSGSFRASETPDPSDLKYDDDLRENPNIFSIEGAPKLEFPPRVTFPWRHAT